MSRKPEIHYIIYAPAHGWLRYWYIGCKPDWTWWPRYAGFFSEETASENVRQLRELKIECEMEQVR